VTLKLPRLAEKVQVSKVDTGKGAKEFTRFWDQAMTAIEGGLRSVTEGIVVAIQGSGQVLTRTITGSSTITVTNGDGIAGNPTIAVSTITEANLTLADVTTDNVTSTKHGFAPKSPGSATQFLNGAATPAFAAVKDSDLSISDITTNNVSTSKHGLTPKLPNDATKYLDGTGAYSVPAGTATSYTDEQARDAIGTALVAGTNVTITVNDGADTITIAATGAYSAGTVPPIVQSAVSTAASASITLGAAPTNGNTLYAYVGNPVSNAIGSGWSSVVQETHGTDWVTWVKKVAGAGESATQSPLTGSPTAAAIMMWEVTGTPTVVFSDITNVQSGAISESKLYPNLSNVLTLGAIILSNNGQTFSSVYNMTQDGLVNTGQRRIYGGHSDLSTHPVGSVSAVLSAGIESKAAFYRSRPRETYEAENHPPGGDNRLRWRHRARVPHSRRRRPRNARTPIRPPDLSIVRRGNAYHGRRSPQAHRAVQNRD
jgi:hypothetical protein